VRRGDAHARKWLACDLPGLYSSDVSWGFSPARAITTPQRRARPAGAPGTRTRARKPGTRRADAPARRRLRRAAAGPRRRGSRDRQYLIDALLYEGLRESLGEEGPHAAARAATVALAPGRSAGCARFTAIAGRSAPRPTLRMNSASGKFRRRTWRGSTSAHGGPRSMARNLCRRARSSGSSPGLRPMAFGAKRLCRSTGWRRHHSPFRRAKWGQTTRWIASNVMARVRGPQLNAA